MEKNYFYNNDLPVIDLRDNDDLAATKKKPSVDSDGGNYDQKNYNTDNAVTSNGKQNISDDVQDKYQKRFTPAVTDADISAIRNLPRKQIDELKRKIKCADPAKIFLPANKSGYICPFCGNGSGRDGDGIKPTAAVDGYVYHCFKSGDCKGDLLNIIATANNLSLKHDFYKILAIGKKIVETAYSGKFDDISIAPPSGVSSDDDDTTALFYIQDDIFRYSKTAAPIPETERRGLTLETLNFVQAFWYPDYIPPKFRDDPNCKVQPTNRMIFPTSKISYSAIIAPSDRDKIDVRYKNLHAGKERYLYNVVDKKSCTIPYKYLIVTEGEIDALSIFQATKHKYLVGATGGAAKHKLVLDFVKARKDDGRLADDFMVIVLFDADNAGRTNAAKAVDALKSEGFLAVDCLIDDNLDANDFLIQRGDAALCKRIEDIIGDAQKQLPNIQAELKDLRDDHNADTSTADVDAFNAGIDELPPPADETCAAIPDLNTADKDAQITGEYDFQDFFQNGFDAEIDKIKKYAYRKTGFPTLDEKQALLPGVYLLGGLPGTGKTTFCWQMANQLADRGEKVIYVTNEMTPTDLFVKSLSSELYKRDSNTTLTATQIKLGGYAATLEEIKKDFASRPKSLKVIDARDDDIDKILQKLNRHCTGDLAPIIFIDYFQIIPTKDPRQEEYSKLNYIAKRLKDFQLKTQATVFVISSLNRNSYNSDMALDSFKGTGNLEYTADCVLGLELIRDKGEARKDAMKKQPRPLSLVCLKNRNGATYDLNFDYYSARDYFCDSDSARARDEDARTGADATPF